jgi:hypothetical protein
MEKKKKSAVWCSGMSVVSPEIIWGTVSFANSVKEG